MDQNKEKEVVDALSLKNDLMNEIKKITENKEVVEFKNFIFKRHILHVCVGFMLGSAMEKLVKSLSECLVMPFVAFLIDRSGKEWRNVVYSPIHGLDFPLGKLGSVAFEFCIISLILYIIIKKICKVDLDPSTIDNGIKNKL